MPANEHGNGLLRQGNAERDTGDATVHAEMDAEIVKVHKGYWNPEKQ